MRETLPGTDIPMWPAREMDDPTPYYCIRCGRVLELRFWRTSDGEARYWYLGCDGEGIGRVIRQLFPWAYPTERGHWTFMLGRTSEPVVFDPQTGKMVDR